jgi:hypothetical protein
VNRREVEEFARRPFGAREVTLPEIAGVTLLVAFGLIVAASLAISINNEVVSYDLNQGVDYWLQFLSSLTQLWVEPWVILVFAIAPGVLKILAFRIETTYDPDVQFADSMSLVPESIAVIVACVGALTYLVVQLIGFVRDWSGFNFLPHGVYVLYSLSSVVICLVALWAYRRIYATPVIDDEVAAASDGPPDANDAAPIAVGTI